MGLFNQTKIPEPPSEKNNRTRNEPEKKRRNRRKKSELSQDCLPESLNTTEMSESKNAISEEFIENVSVNNPDVISLETAEAEDGSDYIEIVEEEVPSPSVGRQVNRGSQNSVLVSEPREDPCEMIKCKICSVLIPNLQKNLMQHVTAVYGAQ